MRFLDLSHHTPPENLACDEMLLERCDDGTGDEILRVWESPVHFVVLGFSGVLAVEVREEACASMGIPVLRRISGGGTVVQGPGVLNYTVVLRPGKSHEVSSVRGAHRFVLGRLARAIETLTGETVALEGESDLAIGGRKISGNAQRRLGRAVMVHGTVLLGLDLSIVEEVLPLPERRPAYRLGRKHADFLRNTNLDRQELKRELRNAWGATELAVEPESARLQELLAKRYTRESWVRRR